MIPNQIEAASPLPAIIAWTQAGFPAEELREMAGIGVAHVKGNVLGRSDVKRAAQRRFSCALEKFMACCGRDGRTPSFGQHAISMRPWR